MRARIHGKRNAKACAPQRSAVTRDSDCARLRPCEFDGELRQARVQTVCTFACNRRASVLHGEPLRDLREMLPRSGEPTEMLLTIGDVEERAERRDEAGALSDFLA